MLRSVFTLLITKKVLFICSGKLKKFEKNAQSRQIEKTLRIRKN